MSGGVAIHPSHQLSRRSSDLTVAVSRVKYVQVIEARFTYYTALNTTAAVWHSGTARCSQSTWLYVGQGYYCIGNRSRASKPRRNKKRKTAQLMNTSILLALVGGRLIWKLVRAGKSTVRFWIRWAFNSVSGRTWMANMIINHSLEPTCVITDSLISFIVSGTLSRYYGLWDSR